MQKGAALLTKGKNHTNDCYVTIALGKTKYQTSIKEKASPNVEWHEECELYKRIIKVKQSNKVN